MTTAPPMDFVWTDDGAMVPLRPKIADQYFAVGETYRLEERHERSHRTHSHYFACVHDAWANLPEALEERFPSADHLRRWALIKTGFRNERSIVCGSPEEAQKILAFIAPMDEYAVVIVQDLVVIHYAAKSQSLKAMGRDEFQRSKTAVLDCIARIFGAKSEQLGSAA
jgi:hypothetical protein